MSSNWAELPGGQRLRGHHQRCRTRSDSSGNALFAAGTPEIKRLLKSHGAMPDPYDTSWCFGRVDMARLFLERGADPVETDAEPWATPRAWAKRKGHAAILWLLDEYQR